MTTIIIVGENGTEIRQEGTVDTVAPAPEKTKRRKKSAYSRAYARHFRAIKKAHPRYSFARIAKMAHKKTRAERKGGTKKGMRRKTARRAYTK